MILIRRYLFRQLLWPTLGVTAALGGVAMLSQTLWELDVLVNQHQSIGVFLTLVALALPQMLVMVLPISLFVAALMVLNRLHTEQEIVVCYAGGLSRWRVISPGLRLASICALVCLVINLWISPWCYRQTREELFRIKGDLVSTLVRNGQFSQPSANLTVYAQTTDRPGELKNVFIDEIKPAAPGRPPANADGDTAFTARTGRIVKQNGKPALLLRDGSNQHFDGKGVLQYVTFDEYVFDLSPYLSGEEEVHYKQSDRYLHELLRPDLTNYWDRKDRKAFLAEANARLASPLYAVCLMSLAMAGVLGGAFSRTGYARRIAIACGAAVVIRILGFGAQAACAHTPALNVVQYLVPLLPTAFAIGQILRRPRSTPRRARAAAVPAALEPTLAA